MARNGYDVKPVAWFSYEDRAYSYGQFQHPHVVGSMCKEKGIEQGIEKGMELGRQEGRSEGGREATLKIARTMLQNGLDRNTLMKMTSLSEDELPQIRH